MYLSLEIASEKKKKMADLNISNAELDVPMLVSDVLSMFLRDETPNKSHPSIIRTRKTTNAFVNTILKPCFELASKDGKILPSMATHLAILISEGCEILAFKALENKGMFPSTNPKLLQEWISFFEANTPEELRENGIFAVTQGWFVVNWELKRSFLEQKYKLFYSKSSDPKDWVKEALENQTLGKVIDLKFPFWDSLIIKNLSIVVGCIMSSPIEPGV